MRRASHTCVCMYVSYIHTQHHACTHTASYTHTHTASYIHSLDTHTSYIHTHIRVTSLRTHTSYIHTHVRVTSLSCARANSQPKFIRKPTEPRHPVRCAGGGGGGGGGGGEGGRGGDVERQVYVSRGCGICLRKQVRRRLPCAVTHTEEEASMCCLTHTFQGAWDLLAETCEEEASMCCLTHTACGKYHN